MSSGALGGQKRALDPMEPQLQVAVSPLMWVLREQANHQ